MILSLMPWSIRNFVAYDSLLPLPHNGGIVLHQVYNGDNKTSRIWIPSFVSYFRPDDIWRGYAQEAMRRQGHSLSAPQVDGYWRSLAVDYIEEHPGRVLTEMFHKSAYFLSANEVPNNRSLVEERAFSRELSLSPAPTPWLLGLGLPGLFWFALKDRRWPIIAAPILVSWSTMALFWPEERFRFYAAPALALCAGLFLGFLVGCWRRGPRWEIPAFATAAALIATLSLYLAATTPIEAISWDRAVWGYIKMGMTTQARELALRVVKDQPYNGLILEALGFMDASDQRYPEALRDFQRAIAARPLSHVAHYNLAEVYLSFGQRENAAHEARIAMSLYPSPRYQSLLDQLSPSR